jgi:OOP family OmpA-OmpF porin
MKGRVILAGLVLAAAGTSSAMAQSRNPDSGFYLGAGVGVSEYNDSCSGLPGGISCDENDTTYKLFGGYDVNRYFGVEAGYVDFGKTSASGAGVSASIDGKGFELSAIGKWPATQNLSLFGRLGVVRWDLDARASGPGASISNSATGTDWTIGIGGSWAFTRNWSARAEWQRYNNVGDTNTTGKGDIDTFGLSVVYKFQ